MTHVIFVTQVIDPQDPVLGNVPSLVRALAARAGSVTVIANEVRDASAVDDVARVISLGKERGASRFARGAALERAVASATRARPAILLAHMCPSYLVLAGPIARVRAVPSILWFTHPAATRTLAAAERVANGIATTLPGSYPRPGPKVRAIGHAIDVTRLPFEPRATRAPLRLLSLGRTSPSKGHDLAIRALALARSQGLDTTLRIVGPSTTPEERSHRRELDEVVERFDVAPYVSIEAGVPPNEASGVIRDSDVVVSAMVGGAADKVVFESMALGRPVVVSNRAFAPLLRDLALDLTFSRGVDVSLASALSRVAEADAVVRESVLRRLRERVEREHSLDHWASSLLAYGEELR